MDIRRSKSGASSLSTYSKHCTAWSSLVDGDEGCFGPSGSCCDKPHKIMQLMHGIILYMFDCWTDPIVVYLILKSSMPSVVFDPSGNTDKSFIKLNASGSLYFDSSINFETGLPGQEKELSRCEILVQSLILSQDHSNYSNYSKFISIVNDCIELRSTLIWIIVIFKDYEGGHRDQHQWPLEDNQPVNILNQFCPSYVFIVRICIALVYSYVYANTYLRIRLCKHTRIRQFNIVKLSEELTNF